MQYRLTLDARYKFATEKGAVRSVDKNNFRPQNDSVVNTYREPVTRIVMLAPSFQQPNYHANLLDITNFRTTDQPNRWLPTKRSIDGAPMSCSVPEPSSTGGPHPFFTLIELLVLVALIAIIGVADAFDNLIWVAESNFNLEADESFVYHYHTITDQMLRKENWFAVQWDNVLIHFSMKGDVRVYRYADRSDMTQVPTLIYHQVIASPTELIGKDGYFWFLPIPGTGLLIQHTQTAQESSSLFSSAQNTTVRGLLIPDDILPAARQADGSFSLFQRSPLRLALNPYVPHNVGFERVTFATNGSYADAIFDTGYKPSLLPMAPQCYFAKTHGSLTPQIMKPDLSGAWAVGDRQARMQIALSTSNPMYTPFLEGYEARWAPVFNIRNTTPVVVPTVKDANNPGRLLELEYSQDEYGVFEGKATALIEGAALKAIAARGDATFLLEVSADNGQTWTTLGFGFATDWEKDVIADAPGVDDYYYKATFELRSIHHRLKETKIFNQMGFDTLSIHDACDLVLNAAGFPPLRNVPALADNITLDGLSGQNTEWKYAPKNGEDFWKTLLKLCFHLHQEHGEYFPQFDYAAWVWDIVAKPRNSGAAWSLATDSGDSDAANRVWHYDRAKIKPIPPEANLILVTGLVNNKPDAERLVGFAVNTDSLVNVDSLDYLGRTLAVEYGLKEVPTGNALNLMLRRIYDRVAHHRDTAIIGVPTAQPLLLPNTYVILEDNDTEDVLDGWVKRSTVKVNLEEVDEYQTLDFDTMWEGALL